MNPRSSIVAVIVAALVFGAFGYLYDGQDRWPERRPRSARPLTAISKQTPIFLPPHPREPGPVTNDTPLAENQVAAVRELIRDHLLANPEIVRDAIEELQRKEMEAELAAQASAISEDRDLIFASTRQAVVGNPDGEVTLVEFFDYNCGYCKRAHADMKRLLEGDPSLRIVLKEFPVLGEASVEAARVSAAVNIAAPEEFSEFHESLLNERGRDRRRPGACYGRVHGTRYGSNSRIDLLGMRSGRRSKRAINSPKNCR